ncbi:MAG: TraR/DksA C4-type zinc finger protein [Candidatus Omnitrophota bacterium]|nr:TraR/DksA C4-type zinc finger protein [Candidatus Omnitrophota bacterium]
MAKVKKARKIKRIKKIKAAGKKRTARPKAVKLKRMPKAELKIFETLLIAERNKVGGELSHIAENTLNKSQRDASGDLSGYSFHMADMASDDYERDFSLNRATEEQKMLYFIDEALKRVKDGTYGNCLQCNKPIAKKRLKALPYTELCIECKKSNEGK